VTVIVPFNWPIAILAASLPHALLAGNTAIVKPPPTTPLATTRVVQRIAEKLPPGVLNVVTGQSRTFVDALEIASTLTGHRPEVSSRPRSKAKVDHGFDNTLLRQHAPAGFTFTMLEDGLRQTLQAAPSAAGERP